MKRPRSEYLASNLPQLQNLIKKDPQSYHDEFVQQLRHFESSLIIFNLKPQELLISDHFTELILFMSHIAKCYPKQMSDYPDKLIECLSNHHQIMAPEIRKTMVQALIIMRNKGIIEPVKLLGLFFTLFRCKDKPLRSLLHQHIVNDIKNSNVKSKNNAMNKTLQNFMYKMLNDTSDVAAKKSLEVMVELYKKNVWNDAKTVNVIAEACLSQLPKIVAPAIHFFLGSDESQSDSDDESDGITNLKHSNQINKKKKSRMHQMEKAKAAVKRKERAKNKAERFNFSALHLINDPQGFAEKLFSRLRQSATKNTFRFELRLQMMNLVSRLIGVHKLILLGFYEFLIPYLKPHQKEVTSILAIVAQSAHELVPPDALEAVVRAIADNFLWSNCSSEVITAGLNGLRETCLRCPLAIPEDLLQSLIDDFKNYREKGPMNACRSLLGLYREANPTMLRKKDRGKAASVNMKAFTAKKYGVVDVMETIECADLLEQDGSDVPDLIEPEEIEEIEEEIGDEEEIEWEEVEESDEECEESDEECEDSDEECEESDEASEGEEVKEVSPAKKRRVGGILAEKILTDEDFARIRDLRMERDAERLAGIKQRPLNDADDQDDEDSNARSDFVDVSKITSGTRKKDDYNARMESIRAGREGREFGSRKGKKERTSTTNREKSKKNKAFMMMVHKRDIKSKSKRSLREKQKLLRAHIKKQKMKL